MTITDEQITAAARALSNDNADVCNVNREDNWNIYGDSFRETARVALEAAFASAPAVDARADRLTFDEWIKTLPKDDEGYHTYAGVRIDEGFALLGWQAALSTSASEAAAGEPVAQVDENDDGLFIEIMYGENGSALKRGDKLYTAPTAASGQKLTDAIRAKLPSIRAKTGNALFDAGTHDACEKIEVLLRAPDSATASDKEGA